MELKPISSFEVSWLRRSRRRNPCQILSNWSGITTPHLHLLLCNVFASTHAPRRKEGETVAEFIADLRKLFEHCKFADTLDDMLRDRLVCGIRDARTQRRLLAEPELTFKKAFDLAQASETAEKNAKQLHQHPSPQPVHALSRPRNPARQHNTASCYRCGGKHATRDCHCQDVVCHNCHKKGHLARVCRSKPRPRRQTASSKNRPRQNTHHVAQGDEASSTSEEQAPNRA